MNTLAAAPPLSPARAARRFHALSDPTRLQIVQMLSHGERCVCELTKGLDAAQSRLSFHLRTLKDAGLVTDRRDGRWVYYALSRDALAELGAYLRLVRPGMHAGSCAAACCA
jgi:ArsR family transcriptional regulator